MTDQTNNNQTYDEYWREYDDTTEREWCKLCKDESTEFGAPGAYLMMREIDKEVTQQIVATAQKEIESS